MNDMTKYALVNSATERLADVWDEDFDQIEAHLESEGFTDDEIMHAMDRLSDLHPTL